MPTIQILLAGVDVTDKVVFAQTSFQSKVNGQPGQGKMRVRDDDSTFAFTVGADWLLLIDGNAAWRGFAMQRKLAYIAPAMNVAESGLQRFVDVWGPDGNILFSRRIVAKTSSPATVEGTQFPAATADTTAITDLLSNWLDLSADSIDTSSGVAHVGDLDPAQKTRAWSGGWAWGDAMNTIAMLPAAIYYLRPESGTPDYTLVYCDADAPTAPFGLSDQPDGVTTKGYRESEIILDATGMINDELAWGMGYGSQQPVFKRLTSTSSVAAHGLWQGGTQAVGVYKQTTIDRIADSIVNGSPSNHRGAKNDRPAVELVTYEPGLLAGHVVDFDSQVWGWSDAIPVRQSDITFEAPDLPRWKLLLSHEIDTPWGFYDQFWPKLPTFPLPCLTPPCIGGTGTPVPTPECQCLDPATGGSTVIDDFARVTSPSFGWGTASGGGTWVPELPPATYPVFSVAGAWAVCDFNATNNQFDQTIQLDTETNTGPAWTAVTKIRFEHWYAISDDDIFVKFEDQWDSVTKCAVRWKSTGHATVQAVCGGTFSSEVDLGALVTGVWYVVELDQSSSGADTVARARVYEDGTTAPDWQATANGGPQTIDGRFMPWFEFYSYPRGLADPDQEFRVGPISVGTLPVDRCTAVQFDDFERTVASGWGTSTPSGYAWTVSGPGGATYSVDGSAGRIDQIDSGTVPNQHGTTYVSVADTAGGWAGDFDMTAKFHVNALPDAAHTGTLGNWGVSLSTTHPLSGSFDQGIVMTKRDNSNGGLDTVQFIPSTGGSVVAYHSWAVGSTYWVRWVKSGTSHKVRVWDDGATEPSTWDIDTTDSAITPLAFFVSQTQPFTRVFTTDPDATMGIWWDSIDFDYAGRPCYYDCTALSAIDDFERTDVVDLGTATPSGIAWTYFGSGSVAYSVDGHSGIRSYGSDLTGVAGTGARLALPTSYPEGVEFYTEFSASGEPVSGFLSWGENIAFGSGSGVGSAWDIIEVSAVPVGFATTWAVTAQNGPGTTTFRTSSAGDASSWWSVRVQRLAGSVRVKAWLRDSEAEPDWQADVARSSSVDPSTAVVDWGGHGANSPSAFGSASLAVLSAGNAGCVPADRVPVGAPTGPTGWGCEVPTRSSSTVYTTTVTFTAGSVLAWRAGLLQRPGTDYTEGSGLQSITFTTAVATGEEVRVCYLAQVVS